MLQVTHIFIICFSLARTAYTLLHSIDRVFKVNLMKWNFHFLTARLKQLLLVKRRRSELLIITEEIYELLMKCSVGIDNESRAVYHPSEVAKNQLMQYKYRFKLWRKAKPDIIKHWRLRSKISFRRIHFRKLIFFFRGLTHFLNEKTWFTDKHNFQLLRLSYTLFQSQLGVARKFISLHLWARSTIQLKIIKHNRNTQNKIIQRKETESTEEKCFLLRGDILYFSNAFVTLKELMKK